MTGTTLLEGHGVCIVLAGGLSLTWTRSLWRTWIQHSGWGMLADPGNTHSPISVSTLPWNHIPSSFPPLPAPWSLASWLWSSLTSLLSALIIIFVWQMVMTYKNDGGSQVLRKLCMLVHGTCSLIKHCVSTCSVFVKDKH